MTLFFVMGVFASQVFGMENMADWVAHVMDHPDGAGDSKKQTPYEESEREGTENSEERVERELEEESKGGWGDGMLASRLALPLQVSVKLFAGATATSRAGGCLIPKYIRDCAWLI